jgi:hypothetical protein
MQHYVTHLGNKYIIYKLKSLHLHKEAILTTTVFFLQINDLQKLIQIKETETNDLLHKERELTEKFQAATNDSTFADFLRKLYNKKYKLQKPGSPGGKIVKYKYNGRY